MHTISDIRKHGRVRGYAVLSERYTDNDTKLAIRWEKCGHEDQKAWRSLQQGYGCGPCRRPTLDQIRTHGVRNGYEVLSRSYLGAKEKLAIRWDCGHEDRKPWNALQQGQGCGSCAGVKRLTIDQVKEHGKTHGYTLLSSEYRGADEKLEIRWLSCGHEDHKSWNALHKGQRCGVCNQGWTRDRIVSVLSSLGSVLKHLDTRQRQILLEKGLQLEGLKASIQRAIVRGDFFDGDGSEEQIGKRVDGLLGSADEEEAIEEAGPEDAEKAAAADVSGYEGLPPAAVEQRLNTLDTAASSISDAEAVEELVSLEVDRLWNATLNDEKTGAAVARAEPVGFGREARDRFLKEFGRVSRLHLPHGYAFPSAPTLMQRLCAFRVKSRQRYGNWSGMGSGKTGGAVLSSRVLGARLTVVVCPNNSAELEGYDCQWGREIKRWFPRSEVLTKTWAPEWLTSLPHYLILNHEMFQQAGAVDAMADFLKKNNPDFVVIDEVHMVKQRSDEASRRRRALSLFLDECELNEGVHVLTMSGTPVINNLKEGVSQIELVQGREREDLPIYANASNCLRINRELVKVGFRQRVDHGVALDVVEIPIECESAIEDLKALGPNPNPVAREEILTALKLPTVLASLKKGERALVYTHYVGDSAGEGNTIVGTLADACRAKGFKVGIYTGSDKSGKAPFMAGKLDVLIASSAIAVGVDGLQDVCHKLIVNVLPWTRADLDQLIGRLWRKGQKHGVRVVIPVTTTQIEVKQGPRKGQLEERSWCRRVLSILRYKKTVADAAVDGVWPDGEIENVETAWRKWLNELG